MNVIEITNLTKTHGKSRGITNVSFHVEEGEIFGFIGPNGAGKSTTIRTLLSLIYPTSGKAEIFGKDCIAFAPEIAKQIGYLPSEVFYYDNMKVIDLLKYSASYYKKDCNKRMKEVAEIMDLDLKKKNVMEHSVSFLFRGDINSVMKKIAEIEIANLWIEEPDLEEIFMHYYEKEV
ncbi:ABC-type multidrug transport system ATPase subunit [Paenibacillus endophyticus]|uniref:ABC-type multidrug transport system ATPase subunit n=1 Tax=Paenibacillus endophyticus TaxID=1294268 RepID=A0A7W5CAX1_9BACL|nr:ATP-binding cassette domain-containing protein [Paenibacillus endophyticus]MBB3153809.1 ABC-type multidrug transport system ATPase subunit [Paenibacillus endophyticus]